MRIITVLGARPQFIKASALSRLFIESSEINEDIIHTGQHYDNAMSGNFFKELDIPFPKYHLNIGSGTHGQQTGRMLREIESILIQDKPDYLLVYGDTNSTLAGALAASKLHIPVIHIEAGLRSFNKKMPEEINRICTDHLSTLLFAPTMEAVEQLKKEGFPQESVYLVGDILYDVAQIYGKKSSNEPILTQINIESNSYFLCTIHRAENTDNKIRLRNIIEMLNALSEYKKILFVIHPRTKKYLDDYQLSKELSDNIIQLPPLTFKQMMVLEKKAFAIITDSGGMQKEAFFHHTPCITLRDETEWKELITIGCNMLVSPEQNGLKMRDIIVRFLSKKFEFKNSPYGNGNTAKEILNTLLTHLDLNSQD